jgi:Lrp/AsnC family transcriptional regulator for asnA, asnC and gidA
VSDPGAKLDDTDLKLIELLQADGRTSNSRLAAALGVTEATVRRRISQMEESRVMRVVAVTDTEARGNDYFFWAWVKVDGRPVVEVAHDVASIPESVTVALVRGDFDVFASFSARDQGHMASVLLDAMGAIGGISRVESALAVDVLLSDVRWARFNP